MVNFLIVILFNISATINFLPCSLTGTGTVWRSGDTLAHELIVVGEGQVSGHHLANIFMKRTKHNNYIVKYRRLLDLPANLSKGKIICH